MKKKAKQKKLAFLERKYELCILGYSQLIQVEIKSCGGAVPLSRMLGKEDSYVRKTLERGSITGLRSVVTDLAIVHGWLK